jgi:hypothetical protein
MRRYLLFLSLSAVLLASPLFAQVRPYVSLGQTAEALRSDFNANADKVRVVILLSPT